MSESTNQQKNTVETARMYGDTPYNVAVIHGGPGAPGGMAPVARELASDRGILEPLQTADSLAGQVEELRATLEEHGELPVTLIGWSWGAWLSFILAANYPACVRKLVLVGSGPFEAKYAASIRETRLGRLNKEERAEVESLEEMPKDPQAKDKRVAFARFGRLFSKADAYDPIEHESDVIEYQVDVFHNVWKDAAEMRRTGKLLELAERIACPVIAIHGDHDPHPAEGVQKPLSAALESFRFVLLQNCGHTPWFERQARNEFFKALKEELHC
jgi:pimeloyl-ACP methyl ester carboxylesterase